MMVHEVPIMFHEVPMMFHEVSIMLYRVWILLCICFHWSQSYLRWAVVVYRILPVLVLFNWAMVVLRLP